MEKNQKKTGGRYGILDSLRGITLISMIIYHVCWDLVYLFGKDWSWYKGGWAYAWQQSICWSFILLSGFCWSLGKKPVKRGLIVFGAGAAVSMVTLLAMPDERVLFGVLTLIGSCMLLMALLDRVLRKIPPKAGLLAACALFIVTRNINTGFLGFEGWKLMEVPESFYRGYFMTFLGFPKPGFYSTDYFSLIPWFFLFLSGYFIYRMIESHREFMNRYFMASWRPFAFLGRHSLLIYMFHQPVAFGVLTLWDRAGLLF